MRTPVIFDGRNIYNPEQHPRARLHLLSRWAGRERPRHRRRRLHRQPRRQGAARPPASDVVIYDNLSAGHRGGGASRGAALGRRRHQRRRRGCAQALRRRTSVDAVMHFAAWLSVGESVRDPAGYYRNNVGGALSVLEAMVAGERAALRLLVDLRGVRRARETPITEDHPQARRSTPTARPSWRSSARCRTSSAPTACGRSRCATSTPPAPIRTASSARTTPRRST